MKKGLLHLTILLILSFTVLSGCESKKLKLENEDLKKQVASLAGDKSAAVSKVEELTSRVDDLTKKNAELQAKVTELTNINKELKSKTAKKSPAKKKTAKKKK